MNEKDKDLEIIDKKFKDLIISIFEFIDNFEIKFRTKYNKKIEKIDKETLDNIIKCLKFDLKKELVRTEKVFNHSRKKVVKLNKFSINEIHKITLNDFLFTFYEFEFIFFTDILIFDKNITDNFEKVLNDNFVEIILLIIKNISRDRCIIESFVSKKMEYYDFILEKEINVFYLEYKSYLENLIFKNE